MKIRNKQRIQALLENVLSSIAIQDCTEEQYKLLEKKLQFCCTIINGNEKKAAHKKFKIKDKISNRKHVSPQKRFVPYTQPRKIYKFPKVPVTEAEEIKKCLSGSEGLNINCTGSSFDHNY